MSPPPRTPRGFSLVEMLATVAALVIVLGLAVSLARYVRRQASDRLTKDLLSQLDELVRRYEDRYQALPVVPSFVEEGGEGSGGTRGQGDKGTRQPGGKSEIGSPKSETSSESGIPNPETASPTPQSKIRNPQSQPLNPQPAIHNPKSEALPPESQLQLNADRNNRAVVQALRVEARRHPDEFKELPPSFEADGTLHDAWGTPIVFMPSMHPAVGMALADDPFFLSAGPDRQFTTREDNLFSYEEADDATGGVSW